MPFSFIPAVLGTAFVLIWLFIGGMMLLDGQREMRRQRELRDGDGVGHTPSQRKRRRMQRPVSVG
jgi:hypothetical protein